MLRMRVYRLSLPITLMGLELWALLLVGASGIIALQFYSGVLPSILPFPAAAATGVLMLQIVKVIKRFFPGRAFFYLMAWITQADRYVVQREVRCMPLIMPGENAPVAQRSSAAPARAQPDFIVKPLHRTSKE